MVFSGTPVAQAEVGPGLSHGEFLGWTVFPRRARPSVGRIPRLSFGVKPGLKVGPTRREDSGRNRFRHAWVPFRPDLRQVPVARLKSGLTVLLLMVFWPELKSGLYPGNDPQLRNCSRKIVA